MLPNIRRTYDQIDQIKKLNWSSLSQIGPILTINKWFLVHTRECEQSGHLGLEQVLRNSHVMQRGILMKV